MNMKFIVLFLLFIPFSAVAEDINVTIHVDDAYQPFSFSENGHAKGMYIDVLRVAFSKMKGFNVTMEPVPWNKGKKMMDEGKGFALTPAFFHGRDWPYLYPYSLPFYAETIISVCTEEVLKQPRPNWPEDYRRLVIGNLAGFDEWGGVALKASVIKSQIDYHKVQSSDVLIKMIINDRLDCILMENREFDYVFKRILKSGVHGNKVHSELIKGPVVGTNPVYIGYSASAIKSGKYPYAQEFQKAFDVVIYQMTKSGEIKKIMNAYQ